MQPTIQDVLRDMEAANRGGADAADAYLQTFMRQLDDMCTRDPDAYKRFVTAAGEGLDLPPEVKAATQATVERAAAPAPAPATPPLLVIQAGEGTAAGWQQQGAAGRAASARRVPTTARQ
jgi:hypothetical protein